MEVLSLTASLLAFLIAVLAGVDGCNMETKEVGVCLHVYLERDFLTMERIVYPKRRRAQRWGTPPYNSYGGTGSELSKSSPQLGKVITKETTDAGESDARSNPGLRQPGPLQWPNVVLEEEEEEENGRHKHHLQKQGSTWKRVSRSAPGNYAVIDAYGQHGWVEGPELADYCSRLATVIRCFEDVLVECNNGYDFFRYRHLLHSLDRVHTYLCQTANDRSTKFLPFLKVINCAENARLGQASCHRPNVTVNVWNQILRLEVGPELCDSLNTQRSCLLENEYIQKECGGQEKEELYKNVSEVFLATWCRLPLHSHLLSFSGACSQPVSIYSIIPLLLVLLAAIS